MSRIVKFNTQKLEHGCNMDVDLNIFNKLFVDKKKLENTDRLRKFCELSNYEFLAWDRNGIERLMRLLNEDDKKKIKRKFKDIFTYKKKITVEDILESKYFVRLVDCMCCRYAEFNLKSIWGASSQINIAKLYENLREKVNNQAKYIKQLINIIAEKQKNKQNKTNLSFVMFELTFPKTVSITLIKKYLMLYKQKHKIKENSVETYFLKSYRLMDLVKKFINSLEKEFKVESLGGVCNLHFWSSKNPLIYNDLQNIHVHFHFLMPLVSVDKNQKNFFVLGKTGFIENLDRLKKIWALLIIKKFDNLLSEKEKEELLKKGGVINFQYWRIKTELDFLKLIHRLRYQARKFFIDVLKFLEDERNEINWQDINWQMVNCLIDYKNKIHAIGWWRKIRQILLEIESYSFEFDSCGSVKDLPQIGKKNCIFCGREIKKEKFLLGSKEVENLIERVEYNNVLVQDLRGNFVKPDWETFITLKEGFYGETNVVMEKKTIKPIYKALDNP